MRRVYILIFIFFGLQFHVLGQQKPLFKMGILADVQYSDIDSRGTRHYRSSAGKLQEAVQQFGQDSVDFVIGLGDFIDKDFKSYDTLAGIMRRLTVPVYHVLGNHDWSVDDGKKKEVLGVLGLKKRYYSLIRGNWRFLFLDGTDVSVFGHKSGSRKSKMAEVELAKMKENNAPNAQEWNGGLGQQQLKWMKRQLSLAEKAGENVVVLCHYPIFPPGDAHNLWNAKEIQTLFEQFNGRLAYFSGHTHKSGLSLDRRIYYVSFRGMVESDENSFAIAEIYPDSIVIRGFGAENSRSMNWGAR